MRYQIVEYTRLFFYMKFRPLLVLIWYYSFINLQKISAFLLISTLRVKRNYLNFHSDSVWCILNEILKHCCHVLSIWRCKTQKYKVLPQTCIIFCVTNFLLITFCTLHKHVSLKLAQYQYTVYLIHNVKTEVVVA